MNVSKKEFEKRQDKNTSGSRSDEAAQSEVTAKALHPGLVPDLKSSKYSDGHPLDEIHYLECKLILKPDRFTAAKTFLEYGALVGKAAKEFGIDLNSQGVLLNPAIREVLFLDTTNFRLYNNAFILRRRIPYEMGFPASDPECVFKFRHPDMQTAAALDVRPNIAGEYRIKFKAEALPLKDRVGGYRLLFSHNVEFGLSQVPEGDRTSMAAVANTFPCLAHMKKSPAERIELVNQTIVEEVLQDLGILDFGKGITAKANVALWRERGMHRPLCGEFAFQAKFKRHDELHEKAVHRVRAFFIALQDAGRDWLSLGTTKTGMVYRLRGNPPQAHE
jgi:hypothetical protein